MYAANPASRERLRWLWNWSLRSARAFWRWWVEARTSDADRRGIELLREWLAPEQLMQFDAYNYFDVVGCDSGKRYRVRCGIGTNVFELDDRGRIKAGWCFVPAGSLVAGDVMLAQKIALETQENGALAVAKQFTPTWH